MGPAEPPLELDVSARNPARTLARGWPNLFAASSRAARNRTARALWYAGGGFVRFADNAELRL